MQEIKEDLKIIRTDLAEIKRDVAINTVSLNHHIKRSDMNEDRIQKLEYTFIGIASVGVLGGLLKVLFF